MYFWNIKKLSKDLDKGLSEKVQFRYLVTMSILTMLAMMAPNEGSFIDNINWVIALIFMVVALFATYSLNGWKKWKDFIIRNLSIWFVTLIRAIVFAIPIILVVSISAWILAGFIWGEEVINKLEITWTLENNIFVTWIMTLWNSIYIFLLIKYFRNFRDKYLKEEKK